MIADRNALEAALKRLGVLFYAHRDVFPNFGPQPVMEAARRVLIVPAHVKARDRSIETLAAQIAPIGRRRARSLSFLPDDSAVALWARKSDAMKFASERNNGAIDEGHRLRQALKLFSKPVGVTSQKGARILNPAPIGKGEYGGALSVANLEGKSLGAWRASQFYGAAHSWHTKDRSLLERKNSCSSHETFVFA